MYVLYLYNIYNIFNKYLTIKIPKDFFPKLLLKNFIFEIRIIIALHSFINPFNDLHLFHQYMYLYVF